MKDFFEKEQYTERDILSMIEGKVEESINLDFESSDSIGLEPSKEKELPKDISSFANSAAGWLVTPLPRSVGGRTASFRDAFEIVTSEKVLRSALEIASKPRRFPLRKTVVSLGSIRILSTLASAAPLKGLFITSRIVRVRAARSRLTSSLRPNLSFRNSRLEFTVCPPYEMFVLGLFAV